jgi:hypothetical protein
LGERLHPDRRELVMSRAEMLTRIDSAPLTAQPLAIEQVRARELGSQPAPAKPFNCFSVQAVGRFASA